MREKDIKDFGSGGRSAQTILIICALLYMINYMDRQVLSVVLEPMKADLGLTDTQAGTLQTIFFLSMSLLAFPISFLIDRWSRRKAVSIMAIVWSAATYMTGLGKSFFPVLFARIFVGTGEAGFSSGGTAWITAAYPAKSRGKALGVFNVAIPVGSTLGVILGGYLSAHYGGWRTPFFVFAIPGIVLGIITFFLPDYQTIKSSEESGTSVQGVVSDTLTLWRTPTLRWLFIGFGMHCVMAFSVLAWVPAVLMRSLGISESEAGLMMGIIGIFAIVGTLSGGWLTDAWQKRNNRGRMLLPAIADALAAILGITGLLLLRAFGGGEVSLSNFYLLACAIAGILYGIFSVMGTPALGAVTQDVVHPRLKGISWGMAMFSMYMLGGAWGPLLVGTLSDVLGGDAHALQMALLIATTTGFLGGICFFIGARHYPEDVANAETKVVVQHQD